MIVPGVMVTARDIRVFVTRGTRRDRIAKKQKTQNSIESIRREENGMQPSVPAGSPRPCCCNRRTRCRWRRARFRRSRPRTGCGTSRTGSTRCPGARRVRLRWLGSCRWCRAGRRRAATERGSLVQRVTSASGPRLRVGRPSFAAAAACVSRTNSGAASGPTTSIRRSV